MRKPDKNLGTFTKEVNDLRKGVGGALGLAVAFAMVLLAVLAALVVVAAVWALGGLVVLLAWNLGVVNVAAAAGGSVGTIGFFTAVGAYVVLSLLRTIFRSGREA